MSNIQKKIIPNYPGRTFSDITYNLRYSLRMFKEFFFLIWNYRPYDYTYTLELIKKASELQLEVISKKGSMQEVDETRIPKENNIKRVIELLHNMIEDNYVERSGYDYNYKTFFDPIEGEDNFEMKTTASPEQEINNDKALKDGKELEKKETDELFDILKNDIKSWWV